MFAFLSQAVTGVFLAMYYRPTRRAARTSPCAYINDEVFLGEFVRGMHKWGSSVMVILVMLHMARTFFFGAYKYPRELNWVIGVVLLILTFVMSFTGYLLPFDQRSYWATIVGVNINGTGPLVGPYLSDFLMGGPEFNATTLVALLLDPHAPDPRAMAAMIGAHLYLVAKQGTTAPPWLKAEDTTPDANKSEAEVNRREKEQYLREYSMLKAAGKPFFPYAVAKDSVMACVTVGSIVVMALLFGAELGPKADRRRPPTCRGPSGTSSSSSSCCV
jgi:quinol-cytochrome oxidoreductase complex cytochrome b subunit